MPKSNIKEGMNRYSIDFTMEERQQYDELAKKHGKRTLAKLIRASLEAVARNPSIIEPTENQDSMKVLKAVQDSFSVFDQLNETLEKMNERLANLERFQEWTVQNLGISKKELKKLQKKDVSGEEVFQ